MFVITGVVNCNSSHVLLLAILTIPILVAENHRWTGHLIKTLLGGRDEGSSFEVISNQHKTLNEKEADTSDGNDRLDAWRSESRVI